MGDFEQSTHLCYTPFYWALSLLESKGDNLTLNIPIGGKPRLTNKAFFLFFLFFFLHSVSRFFLSRKPNVQVLGVLIISSPAWPDWNGLVVLGLVMLLSSPVDQELTLSFLPDCYFCPCRLEASSPGALRLGILVGCWTTSWPPSCTALEAWPMSRVLGACPTSSTISSLGPQMASMRAWPLVGTGDQLGDKPILLATVEFLAHSCVSFPFFGGGGVLICFPNYS